MKINCIAIDDEPLALDIVREYAAASPQLNLVGCYNSLFAAKDRICEGDIHLIFLDIVFNNRRILEEEDTKVTGIDFLRLFPDPPLTIIMTAHYNFNSKIGEHQLNVVDILHKTFSLPRFKMAVDRAAAQLVKKISPTWGNRVPTKFDYTYFKIKHQYVKVSHDKILYLESKDDFIDIRLDSGELVRPNKLYLRDVEARQLVPTIGARAPFMRIHRSFIVAIEKIIAVNRYCSSVEVGGITISVSENSRKILGERLGLDYIKPKQ